MPVSHRRRWHIHVSSPLHALNLIECVLKQVSIREIQRPLIILLPTNFSGSFCVFLMDDVLEIYHRDILHETA